jgi:hypothetical protein
MIYAWEHTPVFQSQGFLLVSLKVPVPSLLSNTMTTGTSIPTLPPILTVKYREGKGIFRPYLLYTLPKPTPLSDVASMAWERIESLVHTCPCLCKKKVVHIIHN